MDYLRRDPQKYSTPQAERKGTTFLITEPGGNIIMIDHGEGEMDEKANKLYHLGEEKEVLAV